MTSPPHPHAARSLVVVAGFTVPFEPLRAAGCGIEVVDGFHAETTEAGDRYMERGLDPNVRAVFDEFVSGAWNHADLIVVDRSYRDVFYYLKELVRLGLAPNLPPVHLFDLLLSRELPVSDYNRLQVERLSDAAARASGRRVGRPELAEAVRAADEVRRQCRRLDANRRRGAVLGSEALARIARIRTTDPAEQLSELEAWNAVLDGRPALRRPRLLLVPGDASDVAPLHAASEAVGANIVAEDYQWGSRTAAPEYPPREDPLDTIATAAHRDGAGPELAPFAARAQWALAAAEQPLEGAILHVQPADRILGWHLPAFRASLERAGVPTLTLIDEVRSGAGFERLKERIAQWLSSEVEKGDRWEAAS